nr:NTP transferase domain-containing protein [Oscillochloris sp. ZM17-4]
MGQPKQLLRWEGRPLVRHVAEQALASRMTGLVIVIGAAANAVRAALAGLEGPALIVENLDYWRWCHATGGGAGTRCCWRAGSSRSCGRWRGMWGRARCSRATPARCVRSRWTTRRW